MSKVNVVVRLKESQSHRIDEVASALSAKGMDVQAQMPILGHIAGVCDESQLDALQDVPGVASVRRERTFTI
ncbi:MAG: hypothetical protein KAX47_04890 [Zoogloea sp.]|nr:hypothetical protein [Zoogloea sp.]